MFIEKECVICGKKFKRHIRVINRSKYCSRSCADRAHYLRHKETYVKNAERWKRENQEKSKEISKRAFGKFYNQKRGRFRELMRGVYQRNKKKWNIRRRITNSKYGEEIRKIKGNKCELCGSTENLEFHHLTYKDYPNLNGIIQGLKGEKKKKKMEEMVNLIIGKVKLLCRKCHTNEHKKEVCNEKGVQSI